MSGEIMLRDIFTTMMEIAGLVSIVIGIWIVYWPAGVISLGLALLLLGYLAEREESRDGAIPTN